MAAPRRFDHDECRALFATGDWSKAALARKYGVTDSAIHYAVDGGAYERMLEAVKRWTMSGVCESCGKTGITSARHREYTGRPGRVLCATCAGKARRKKLRLTAAGVLTLTCGHCHETKPLDDFGPRVRRRLAEGKAVRRTECRACQTKARNDYRERHKVPCRDCGQPHLPANEANAERRGLTWSGLCLDCYRASIRKTVLAATEGTES